MDNDTLKTIVMLGVFDFIATIIMLTRLAMRRYRKQWFNLSDYLTMVAIVFLLARSGLTTVVVLWGNNNLTAVYRASNFFTNTEIYQREIGSKLTIANRIVYNTYIWIQKSIVLLLYRRILHGLHWPSYVINFYWVFLGATYLIVQTVTFVECHPFYLYWQVVPDPGICPQAPIQLIVFVALNIATDMGLIVLPMPWLLKMRSSLKRRLSLVGLFSIGFLLIAIGFVRLPIYGNSTSQVNRNTWGSVEGFAAAFVANVPTLFALRHKVEAIEPTIILQSHHKSEIIRFGQVKDFDITVTNSIELRNDAIDEAKILHEHRELWDRQASNDNLVSSELVIGTAVRERSLSF